MTTYLADDAATIAKFLKEIEKATQERVTGTTLPEEPKVGEVAFGWAYNPADYDPS